MGVQTSPLRISTCRNERRGCQMPRITKSIDRKHSNTATDHVSKAVRSSIMRAVKSKGGHSTERKLRSAIASQGISGWKTNVEELPGKPDVVFVHERLAVFVDGCFWHGCPKCYRRPQSNQDYWDRKVARNIQRDKTKRRQLRRLGWSIVQLWEHDFKVSASVALKKIRKKIGQDSEC